MKNKSTINGVKWNAINSIASQASTVITGVVLMRLLSPDAFGLIGMITVFTGFLKMLKDSGLGVSLIYKKDLTKYDKDTVFWFNFVFGLLLSIIFFFSSGFLADYYDEPELNNLIKVFSLTFVFSSLSGVHGPLLKKHLQYKKIFMANITSIVVSSILTIIAAFSNFGVWSLVILHLSASIIYTINLYFVSDYRPSFNFSKDILKSHFDYSLPVLGTKSFNYLTRNADNFFIGSLLGSQALGYYSRAFFFVNMPIQKISNIIGSILFPSLSLKKDKKQSKNLLLNAMNMTAFITFPLIGGLIVLSEPFVVGIFGEQWKPMVLTLQILSILTLFESVFVFTTSIFYAHGATKLYFRLSVIYGLYNIVAFYIGSLYSIEAVAGLLLIGYILFMFPKLYYAGKLIDLRILEIFKILKSHFIINFIVMFLVYVASIFLLHKISMIILLIIGIATYLILFTIISLLMNKKDLLIFIDNLKKVIIEKG
ncbi:lipopolysaccharide biosynthesis protein [Polaribacter litorisediminis]|uniref:lipopolysaccharide biosynthesis protein n=1 Tax=Polaribacter litorisediminis TaxID=1908341 RepID=UPI001CBCA95D|nr:lipopolysaccharide biosynthesis protein [Polaribacter litorisediminis]UAM96631.1 lipopolysaccharide biosynthesis protein [Polaribacter litorisediminis]